MGVFLIFLLGLSVFTCLVVWTEKQEVEYGKQCDQVEAMFANKMVNKNTRNYLHRYFMSAQTGLDCINASNARSREHVEEWETAGLGKWERVETTVTAMQSNPGMWDVVVSFRRVVPCSNHPYGLESYQ